MSEMAAATYNAINLRLSHPKVYRGIVIFALMSIGLGLNFWFARPTFNPYHIPLPVTGTIFLALGIGKLAFLIIHRRVGALRIVMTIELVWMCFWAIGTSITFFQGRTSLQLFILYFALVMLEIYLLIDLPEPLSWRKEGQ
jgi:hypothetical protein